MSKQLKSMDNGQLKIGNSCLPKGWEIKKLNEIANIKYGYTESASLDKIGPKFLRITDIQNGNVNWLNVPYCKINNDEINKYLLKNGDIVFARTGATTGKSYLIKGKIPTAVFASYLIRVQTKNGQLYPHFLYQFFQTAAYWKAVTFGTSGSAQGGVNATKLGELSIPIPSLPEQERIVAILDKAFTSINKAKSNAEKNLANAKELFESYLNGIFENQGEDWEEKRLGEVLKLEYGKPLDKSKRKNTGLYPVYGANGIKARSDEFYYDKQSIIVGRKGSAGEINLTENNFWPLDVTYFVTFDDKKYDLFFLFYLLSKLALPRLAKGVKPGINRNDVYSLTASIPPFTEQKRIVAKLNALSAETKRLEELYQKKIADVDELKKSILKKAFEGKL